MNTPPLTDADHVVLYQSNYAPADVVKAAETAALSLPSYKHLLSPAMRQWAESTATLPPCDIVPMLMAADPQSLNFEGLIQRLREQITPYEGLLDPELDHRSPQTQCLPPLPDRRTFFSNCKEPSIPAGKLKLLDAAAEVFGETTRLYGAEGVA